MGGRRVRYIRAVGLLVPLALMGCRLAAPGASADLSPSPSVSSAPTASPTAGQTPTATSIPSPGPTPAGECDPAPDPLAPVPPTEPSSGGGGVPFYDRYLTTLQTYADRHSDTLGGIWIDWSDRTITLSFTTDLDRHRARIRALVGDRAAFKVVPARYTRKEMHALLSRVFAEREFNESIRFQPYSAGYNDIRNRVEIDGAACHIAHASAEIRAKYGTDRVTVTLYPLPGKEPAQPRSGAGWRLLKEVPFIGVAENPVVAGDLGAYHKITQKLGVKDAPAVDFDTEVAVAVLTHGGPDAGKPDPHPCSWVHFSGVEFDTIARRVVVTIRHPRPPGVGCDTAFVGFTYLVALQRAKLPLRPFALAVPEHDQVAASETIVR